MPFLNGGRGKLIPSIGGGAVIPWYLAGGVPLANCIAAYQPIGAASRAASYLNLANLGVYDCTAPVADPTFAAATGWTGNGSTQYLDTGITITGAESIIVRFANRTNAGMLIGHFNTNQRFQLYPNRTGTVGSYGYGNSSTLDFTPPLDSGVLAQTPVSFYVNGVAHGSLAAYSWTGTSVYTWPIFGRRRSDQLGAIDTYFGGDILAIAYYSVTITPTQVADITVATNAL